MILKQKVILLSLIIGIIYVLPHILFIFEQGKNYHLFYKIGDDTLLYAPRVREIYDGNYLNSDPYIYENKARPYIRPFLSEYLVGTLGKILGLSIDNLFILGDFIFPIIIFYLLFYFINLFVQFPSLSLIGSTTILLAAFPASLTALIKLSFSFCSLAFSRTIAPQFHYIFFVLCLIFIYRALVNCKIIDILLSGLFLGLLFYVYPFFWAHIFMDLAILFLFLVFKRQFKKIKIIIFILTEALVISIPFWINYLRLMHLPFYNEMIMRIAFEKSHQIYIERLSLSTLIIFIAFYKKRDFNFFFLLSFLLGGLLCVNQHILTGWTCEPVSWYYYVNRQVVVIAGILLLERFLEKARFRERFIRFFLISSITFSISTGIIIQVNNYEENKYIQSQQQHLYEAFVWLQDNTKKEDVVLASDTVSLLIPVHTHNNVYWSSYILEYASPNKEVFERFFLVARLLGMDEKGVIDYILADRADNLTAFFGAPQYKDPDYKDPIRAKVSSPQDLCDYIIQRYRIFQKEDIKTQLLRFRADYLFYSSYEQLISKGKFKKEAFLDKVYDYGGIQIYKIIK